MCLAWRQVDRSVGSNRHFRVAMRLTSCLSDRMGSRNDRRDQSPSPLSTASIPRGGRCHNRVTTIRARLYCTALQTDSLARACPYAAYEHLFRAVYKIMPSLDADHTRPSYCPFVVLLGPLVLVHDLLPSCLSHANRHLLFDSLNHLHMPLF